MSNESLYDVLQSTIADLERQVAALTKDRDEALNGYAVRDDEVTGFIGMVKELREQLAASQAREQQLREAMVIALGHYSMRTNSASVLENALAFPTDDTALQARLAEEREKVAQMILDGSFLHTEAPVAIWARGVAAAIRRMT